MNHNIYRGVSYAPAKQTSGAGEARMFNYRGAQYKSCERKSQQSDRDTQYTGIYRGVAYSGRTNR